MGLQGAGLSTGVNRGGGLTLKRLLVGLATVMLLLTTGVRAQSPSPSLTGGGTFCITIAGSPPQSEWTSRELQDAIVLGEATIEAVEEAEGCRSTVSASTDTPVDVEVVDAGFTAFKSGGTSWASYAVVLRNPNATGWIAGDMTVVVNLVAADGSIVASEEQQVMLDPGQTSAIADEVFDVEGAKTIEVTVSNGSDEWYEYEYATPVATFTKVKTRTSGVSGTSTTGRLSLSNVENRHEDLAVVAVYYDSRGDVLGGTTGNIPFYEPGSTTSFKTDGLSTFKRVGDTVTYFMWSTSELYG
jgi:hypothetical protein